MFLSIKINLSSNFYFFRTKKMNNYHENKSFTNFTKNAFKDVTVSKVYVIIILVFIK